MAPSLIQYELFAFFLKLLRGDTSFLPSVGVDEAPLAFSLKYALYLFPILDSISVGACILYD